MVRRRNGVGAGVVTVMVRVARSAVAEALVRTHPLPMEFVGMNDQFGKSGEYEELSSYFKMDSAAIGEAVKKVIARK